MSFDHTRVSAAVSAMLAGFGEDLARPGIVDTPDRVARAWREMLSGNSDDAATILGRVFEDPSYDEMVVLDGIDFVSICEHHLLPFTGRAAVAYIPDNGRVVGISKLARVVDCYARRLQIQERMTVQIATAINEHLKPKGVGVVLSARHHCIGCRGVKKPDTQMLTSCLLGIMRDGPPRQEMFALARLR